MAQLSEFVALFKRAQGAKHRPGKPGVRTDASAPAMPGMARGTSGVLGSRLFQSRDSHKGERKELETMRSPIFQAFLQKQMPQTPVADYLQGRIG